jgi:NADH:ubiquinone oxidoreductase subunit F (NADH-binding)
MDRTMIEGDPHRLLEGMLIAAWAIGASRGYIYVRAEYPLAVKVLRGAIEQARAYGALGRDVLGSGMEFDLVIKEGAGAFVCGEETALMQSIEGERGMPRMRPPYPSEHGLWGYPTSINNVETFASVPSILLNGPDWFAALGTARSGGTKAFALTGAVRRAGLVEVPIGISLREMVLEIAGGCQEGRSFKAVQLGGPSGGCIPAELLDTRVDYEDLRATGAMMGSGGMVVVSDATCMVDFARYFLRFSQDESCGKCVPCRVGTRKLLGLLTRITRGEAVPADLDRVRSLCETVGVASLCGLGQNAPNPVLTTLRYFEPEYRAHIVDRTCPAGACQMPGARDRGGNDTALLPPPPERDGAASSHAPLPHPGERGGSPTVGGALDAAEVTA